MSVALTQDRGDHLLVTLSAPGRRNALSPAMYDGIREALTRASELGRIGAVVLTGAEGYFCAGGDIRTLSGRAQLTRVERCVEIDKLHAVIRAIRACPRPVIAAVEGGAAGAGLSIALACDLFVAAEDAAFAAAYVKIGLVPDGGLTASLMAGLPRALVAKICLTGDPIDAPRLAALGVVSDLVAPGQTVSHAADLAARFANGPSAAQAAIKTLLQSPGFDAQLDRERDAMAVAQGGPEAAEGLRARRAKTAPAFAATRAGRAE